MAHATYPDRLHQNLADCEDVSRPYLSNGFSETEPVRDSAWER